MSTTINGSGILFPDATLQTQRATTPANPANGGLNVYLSGTFTVQWGTWINLFQGQYFGSYNMYVFTVSWAYDYSYFYGTQFLSSQGGFGQLPGYSINGGTNRGSTGWYTMNGCGSYGEYAGLNWYGGNPQTTGQTNYWRIYCGATGGTSGYIPNAGGTATWSISRLDK